MIPSRLRNSLNAPVGEANFPLLTLSRSFTPRAPCRTRNNPTCRNYNCRSTIKWGVLNLLKQNKRTTVVTLLTSGTSRRQIARDQGVPKIMRRLAADLDGPDPNSPTTANGPAADLSGVATVLSTATSPPRPPGRQSTRNRCANPSGTSASICGRAKASTAQRVDGQAMLLTVCNLKLFSLF